MDRSTAMAGAARDAMRHVLDLAPADRVLVVTDPESAACGEAFARGAREHGCTVRLHTLPAAGRPLTAVPDDLRVLLPDATVVVNTLVGDAAEVPFRLKWIQLIEGAGRIRLGHSPGIDPDMMVSGALGVDYARMAELARDLRAGLADAVSLHLTAPGGTDLRLDLTGRPWTDDLKATVDTGANLPCGEVYCAPLETGADGVVVCDGCFGAHGTVAAPVRIAVAGGRATDVACADADLAREVTALMDTDPGARTIAELGIGHELVHGGVGRVPDRLGLPGGARAPDHEARVVFDHPQGLEGAVQVSVEGAGDVHGPPAALGLAAGFYAAPRTPAAVSREAVTPGR